MSAAAGVPAWARELEALARALEDLANAEVMVSGVPPDPICRAEAWDRMRFEAIALSAALAAASGPDAGTGEQCPFCDSSPCEGLDECRSYTAMCHRQAQAKPSAPASGAAPKSQGHKWSDAAVVAAMDAPPCNGETVSNPGVCGYCARNMLSAALAVDFPALVSAAAPEERDGELSRLLWRFCEQAQPLGRPDLIEIALDAIRAHVAQVKREAHDIGFRRGLRELPPDLRRPPEDDELPRAVDMMAAMEAPAPARGDARGETRVPDERNEMLAALAAVGIEWSEGGWGFHGVISDLGCKLSDALRLYRAATGEVVGTGVTVGGVFQTPADGPSSVTVYLDPPIRVIGPETRVSLVRRRDKEGV